MRWNADTALAAARGYREACVIAAAADLELFDAFAGKRLTQAQAARRVRGDRRAVGVLLDALAALGLLGKSGRRYFVPQGVASALTEGGGRSVLAMCQHHANCMRRWAQLARCVRTGRPSARVPSVRGGQRDHAAFIGGMHNLSSSLSRVIVADLQPLRFTHLLDVGGASGTWTIAFLEANPSATATLFDLPRVIPLARRRLAKSGWAGSVRLVPGDFCRDELPKGADLAWVSAIAHQNSRAQNRELFRKICRALEPGGRIAIRDVVMSESRTRPVSGALFAVNMLVSTAGGGTFTFREIAQDLRAAGFAGARLARRGEGNESVVVARRRQPSRRRIRRNMPSFPR
jgi:precorrin-6B methylase 2